MSAETYTIDKVSQNVRDVKLDHGEFKSYGFTCVGRDGVYSLLQKPDSSPPKAGDTFEATVKNVFNRDDGVSVTNLKKIPQQRGQHNGGRGHSPEERESIERQVAAKCASDLLVGFMAAGWKPVDTVKLGELHAVLARSIASEIKT